MPESEFTIVNGVKVRSSSIEYVDPAGSRPDGSRGVQLKNGTHILIPLRKQDKNATIIGYNEGDFGPLPAQTTGYNLIGVTISAGGNGSVWLTDSKQCAVNTNTSGSLFGEKANDIRLTYTQPNHPKTNVIDSDSKDNLTIVEDYYPRTERKLGGKLHGRY